jgi:pimeloyl-ACP methyl ester carboxylesterase
LSFRLPTNRLISWAEYGSPQGRPLIFLHGTPSSRLECAEFHNELKSRNIRLIAPDRPGFGRSEFLPGRTIGEYATDVLALAKHLDLTKYSVMGGSGGGPYALACARYLQPEDGLQGVCVFAGMSPYECDLKGMSWQTSFTLGMANWTPRILRFVMRLALPTPTGDFTGPIDQWTVDPSAHEAAKKKTEAFVKTLKGREKEVMGKPGVADYMAAATVESLIQGFDPYMYEAKLFAQPWDFKIEDITLASEGKGPIYLIYGTDDVNTTIHMGRWIAKRVRGSSIKEVKGETHLTLAERFVDYCDEFLQMT